MAQVRITSELTYAAAELYGGKDDTRPAVGREFMTEDSAFAAAGELRGEADLTHAA